MSALCSSLAPSHSLLSKLTVAQEFGKALGPAFTLITAFSREAPGKKVYVQHRLREHAAEVNTLLAGQPDKGIKPANVYVCGDAANMARDVAAGLAAIVAEQRGVGAEAAEGVVRGMRSRGQYQEDVWS